MAESFPALSLAVHLGVPPLSIIGPFPHHVSSFRGLVPIGPGGPGVSPGVAVEAGVWMGVGVGDVAGVGVRMDGAAVLTIADRVAYGSADVT
ncbi:hypothetical protein GCM10023194_52910 [Planotetraspora phitsanulokensis]|uniref:Uncharacterized protein n=1 Tax=Planotetraspora phitsanulokensis TaxID=575192 RepID=A0A8J3UHY9_9ACTN|nr:hypothetical protein Pph01_76320 [Planotetraspora phitsanulokensis]